MDEQSGESKEEVVMGEGKGESDIQELVTEWSTDIEMFHNESCKSIYFEAKRLEVKVTRHDKQCRHGFLHSCECRLVLIVILFLYMVNLDTFGTYSPTFSVDNF